jgi:hypothetical protein
MIGSSPAITWDAGSAIPWQKQKSVLCISLRQIEGAAGADEKGEVRAQSAPQRRSENLI